ncbi:putative naringenin-chalcone synthase [Spelaeicoccus albus]|uniref:Putative naringenin-chalcone synthase n=1 Tax=Spelaeicoccus albus TaxID=1280376 RepID=A0A7Z0IIW5_9MICO|nr:putative naringenin-chalcone synthase [Spelaeicoccus albus]
MSAIETATPSTVLDQEVTRDRFAAQPDISRLGERLIGACFNASGIDTRHTVIAELSAEDTKEPPVFYDRESGELLNPGTQVRNDLYIRAAPGLYCEAAELALKASGGFAASDVTHVITVSCTGFFAPGPDYLLVRRLGLTPSVQRYHIGFMGCYASFPALRAAATICAAEPEAVVLVVSAELCTLHVRTSNDPDQIVASSVFSDGAAAAVVSGRRPSTRQPALSLDHFETVLTPTGEDDMAWTIGDHGFDMVLSTYVPHIIDENIAAAMAPLFASDSVLASRPYSDVDRWAIHPGGRSILDKVESTLNLSADQLAPSRQVLRDYGNMSSATVLYILAHILRQPASAPERVCAMAFGPGLTVESALLTKEPGA